MCPAADGLRPWGSLKTGKQTKRKIGVVKSVTIKPGAKKAKPKKKGR